VTAVIRVVDAARAARLAARAAYLPQVLLEARDLADLELLSCTLPLPSGSGDRSDHAELRAALYRDGVVGLAVAVTYGERLRLRLGGKVGLWDGDRLAGVLRVDLVRGRDGGGAVIAGPVEILPVPTAAERPRGYVVWLTGLSGAGKSSLASALHARLVGVAPTEILDGDAVRAATPGVGFSRQDRDANVRRIGAAAGALARHGVATIVAAISPHASARAEVRADLEAAGVPFVEVWVRAAQAAAAAYEPPEAPDAEIATDAEAIEHSADRLVGVLAARGLVGAAPPPSSPSPFAVGVPS